MKDQVTERALKIARERHGWNQPKFAEMVGVEKQHVTNWLSRGMPGNRYASVAAALKITVDELLGGKSAGTSFNPPKIAEKMVSAYGVALSEDSVLFAAEWAKLPPALRQKVSDLVTMTVAEIARDERIDRHEREERRKGPKTKPRPPSAPQRSS